jgi:hypothetical protein
MIEAPSSQLEVPQSLLWCLVLSRPRGAARSLSSAHTSEQDTREMVTVTGPCRLKDDCISSRGYPDANYGDSESCTVAGLPVNMLTVVAFDVEPEQFCT